MIGSNKDEQSLFLGHLPWVTGATFDNLPEAMKPYLGERAAEIVAKYRAAQPDAAGRPGRPDLMGELGRRLPSLQMAERKLALKAADVFVYLFTWETPVLGGRLRVLPHARNPVRVQHGRGRGDHRQRSRAPAARRDHGARLDRLRQDAAIPAGRPYDTTTRPTMVFDLQSRVENDPFGAERRAWED